jgi:hypothetical protein
MKKVAFKVTNANLSKFIDAVTSINAKPIISITTEGFFDNFTLVWFLLNDEQIEAFKTNGLTPEKTQ